MQANNYPYDGQLIVLKFGKDTPYRRLVSLRETSCCWITEYGDRYCKETGLKLTTRADRRDKDPFFRLDVKTVRLKNLLTL